jgi:hypothetical protein
MTSTRPKIADHNAETDEVTVREMTDAEWEQYQADVDQMQAQSDKFDAHISAKKSAIAKLAALGLTEEEAKAILG